MSKSAEAFRTISEVAEVLDTPAHVLRFWESRFTQIKPVKRAGGRRYYRPADVALLSGIRKLLHEDGLTIRGVQKILREHGQRHVASFATQDFEIEGNRPAPTQSSDPWPVAPSPETAGPATTLLPDPDDVVADDLPADAMRDDARLADDLFAAADRPQVANTTGPFATPLPKTAPGVEARAELQRERQAATQMQTPIERGAYRDLPPEDGDPMPAAALLRAMTAVRAGRRREEMRAIYLRLSALHRRRRDLGHKRSD